MVKPSSEPGFGITRSAAPISTATSLLRFKIQRDTRTVPASGSVRLGATDMGPTSISVGRCALHCRVSSSVQASTHWMPAAPRPPENVSTRGLTSLGGGRQWGGSGGESPRDSEFGQSLLMAQQGGPRFLSLSSFPTSAVSLLSDHMILARIMCLANVLQLDRLQLVCACPSSRLPACVRPVSQGRCLPSETLKKKAESQSLRPMKWM